MKIKHTLKSILPYLPKKIAHSILFYSGHGYFLNWNNPITYDEKIEWAIVNLFGVNEAVYADKYKVRSIIEDAGFKDLLPKVYGVWKRAEDIDFDSLPDSFVLKTNNGCGSECIEICRDKSNLDKRNVINKFKKALNIKIWKYQCEYHYKYIKPLVFAEEFLDDHKEERLIDYKIHCFNGEPNCVLVCSNRAGESLNLDYYDLNWNYLDVVPKNMRSKHIIERPEGLPIMIDAARKLSSRFPTARIDFYDIDGRVYFGEITLSPAGGHLTYINDKWQHIFGDLVDFTGCEGSFIKK